MTSSNVVQMYKGVIIKRVGHAGTLDLSLRRFAYFVGKPKAVRLLADKDKEYIAEFAFGRNRYIRFYGTVTAKECNVAF